MLHVIVRVVLALVLLVVIAGAVAYGIGTTLPVDHVAMVTGTVAAPPARVYKLITNITAAPRWRPAIKKVTVLAPVAGQDHWLEDLGNGFTMDFTATRTDPVTPTGLAPPRRPAQRRSQRLRRHLDLRPLPRPHP